MHLSIQDGAEDLAAGRGYICVLLPKVGVVGQAIVLVCGNHRHDVAVPVRGRVCRSRIDIHPCMHIKALVSEGQRYLKQPTLLLPGPHAMRQRTSFPCQEIRFVSWDEEKMVGAKYRSHCRLQ